MLDRDLRLFREVCECDETTVEALIISGANVNAIDEEGGTPLFYAVWNGNEKIIPKLFDCGADINAKDNDGKTALVYAMWKENKSMVEKLKKYGADVNAKDKNDSSPLHYAAWNNKKSMITTLIKCGADINATDEDCATPLFYAVRKGNEEVVKKLIEEGDTQVDARDRYGRTPLFYAMTQSLSLATYLLDKGANPNEVDSLGRTPLHICCRNIVEVSRYLSTAKIKTTVHCSMIKLLLSHGADYRISDGENQSCLDIAWDFPAVKELLIENFGLDRYPVFIKPWKSVSKKHELCLAKVARHLESEHLESYWYHKDQLASGSFGGVYVGINENDGREVAIKRIVKKSIDRPQDKREIQNLTALAGCEQVVLYVHFLEDKYFSFIVLELMEGNLDELLEQTITEDVRVRLCRDVVMGLKYLHSKKIDILHRDLKPTNILYKRHPKLCLKIADFGLSRRIDSTRSYTTVYGTNAGTRCWIAPEVLSSTKPHSKSSDMFACGLVLHYILSVKQHPFASRTKPLQHETETNMSKGNMEGWNNSLCPEAAHLLKAMLDGDKSKRPSADKALEHPFFWSKNEKLDLLIAVGNQPEFGSKRTRRTPPLTAVETDLDTSFRTIVKFVNWNDQRYVQMPAIYAKMTTRRGYNTNSVVELVRFIRNAYAHVTELPPAIQNQLLNDFVFFKYFPNLVMEVYKVVTTHGWDKSREEIKHALR